jgi:rod shape-determining protein MreC
LREHPESSLRPSASRQLAQRLMVPFLVVASLVLIVLGKADLIMFERVRVAATDLVAPVLAALASPTGSVASGVSHVEGLFDLYEENQRLREENDRLLQWQTVARRLAAQNEQLRALTQYQPSGASFSIAAQVIANSGGAFARNVLIDVGEREGVARGQAAVTGEGLVGRVAEVGQRTARILLLSDLNSRIPVVVGTSGQRAVLAGDNSAEPLLLFLPGSGSVKVGDRVVTGGAEGVFPPDLPVGTVASINGDTVRVAPFAALARLDYVRVVDLGLSAFLPQPVAPPPAPRIGAKPRVTPIQH